MAGTPTLRRSPVSLDEIDFYKGNGWRNRSRRSINSSIHAYTRKTTSNTAVCAPRRVRRAQITAQSSLHDTELTSCRLRVSVLTLLNQTDENLSARVTPICTLSVTDHGNLQTNANVANTSNGGVLSSERCARFDRRGPQRPHRASATHWNSALRIYLRAFTENTDNASRSLRASRSRTAKGRRQPNGNFRY